MKKYISEMMLDRKNLRKIIEEIPHRKYNSVFGEVVVFKLVDLTRAMFPELKGHELKNVSKLLAEELRALEGEIKRRSDGRYVVIFFEK